MKSRSLLLLTTLAACGYAAAYVDYRRRHIEHWQHDGHAYVLFESRTVYYIFRPMSYLDQATTDTRAHIGPHR